MPGRTKRQIGARVVPDVPAVPGAVIFLFPRRNTMQVDLTSPAELLGTVEARADGAAIAEVELSVLETINGGGGGVPGMPFASAVHVEVKTASLA
jgi:hypothetical protein